MAVQKINDTRGSRFLTASVSEIRREIHRDSGSFLAAVRICAGYAQKKTGPRDPAEIRSTG